MALSQSLVDRMRRKVGDTGTTQTFSDAVLSGFILDAVAYIETRLPGGYSADYTNIVISPDPTGIYQELHPLQGAIELFEGAAGNQARRALRVRDGDSEVALGLGAGNLTNHLKLLIEERERLLAWALANGLGAEGDIWTNTQQVIESVPSFNEAMNDEAMGSVIVIEP